MDFCLFGTRMGSGVLKERRWSMSLPVYTRDEDTGRLAVFTFFSVLSFYASNPLVYLVGVGICYYVYHVVMVCIKAMYGETPAAQLDNIVTDCPYWPLQLSYMLYGMILGLVTYLTPTQEFVSGERVVSTYAFFFLAVAYFLWGLTRLVHNYKYYRREFERIK